MAEDIQIKREIVLDAAAEALQNEGETSGFEPLAAGTFLNRRGGNEISSPIVFKF